MGAQGQGRKTLPGQWQWSRSLRISQGAGADGKIWPRAAPLTPQMSGRGPRGGKARRGPGERQRDTDRWWQTQTQRTDKWGMRGRHRDGSVRHREMERGRDEGGYSSQRGGWARTRPGPTGQARCRLHRAQGATVAHPVPGCQSLPSHAHWDPTVPPPSPTCRVGLQGFGDREGGPRWGIGVLSCSPAREGG